MPDYENFLKKAGWLDAQVRPLAGDASNRRYMRVKSGSEHAVLMDAAPERGEDTEPFLRIAAHLQKLGLHAPEVLFADPTRGLVLLEDLGDDLYARVFEVSPDLQEKLYKAAIDALVQLQSAPLPEGELPDYTSSKMADAARLAAEWYADASESADLLQEKVLSALNTLDWSDHVLVLRDYHAENLIWIDKDEDLRRVGLIDFQDAAIGHPVYDVVSLLQDARRDVPGDIAAKVAQHFYETKGIAENTFETAAAVLGAQRALRILGVFARLSLHFNKPSYVDLIPRVWSHLQINLRHPALAELARVVEDQLPMPSTTHLESLKSRAGTCPSL